MNRKSILSFLQTAVVCFLLISCAPQSSVNVMDIAKVPGSFPVNFSLYSTQTHQFVAYYDTAHYMVLAARQLGDEHWDYARLDSKIGWDSHNYLSLAVDEKQHIHLVGNMHSSPLVYFRSTQSLDIHSMSPIHYMTGEDEGVTTYPECITGPDGELIFHYRYGRSGNGYEVYNTWDADEQKWSRLLDQPLIDGQGEMNAYMQGPLLGPDGYYHLLWVWRNMPDCATNHTLSYARSKDLLHWESIRGEQVQLPITFSDSVLQVDATPVNGGLINIGIRIGFDCNNNVLAGYHKYDNAGNTQLFVARFEKGDWVKKQLTDWDYRWDFKGWGTIQNELLIDAPQCSDEKLSMNYHHIKYGDGTVLFDKGLNTVCMSPYVPDYPLFVDSLKYNSSDYIVNKVFDSGQAGNQKKYLLRWETKEANRDEKPDLSVPATILQLIEYE